jgi:dephospho-CoA kinase
MNMYIGVCGPSGAGKDTFANLIAAEGDYVHVSGGDVLREMLVGLGLEPKKTALGPFGEFIRAQYGLEPLFRRVLEKAKGHDGVIISGIRSPAEAQLLKDQGGVIIYVDCPVQLRYERIIARSRENDVMSFEEFDQMDKREHSGAKDTDQNLTSIKRIADYTISNDGSPSDLTVKLTALKLDLPLKNRRQG